MVVVWCVRELVGDGGRLVMALSVVVVVVVVLLAGACLGGGFHCGVIVVMLLLLIYVDEVLSLVNNDSFCKQFYFYMLIK